MDVINEYSGRDCMEGDLAESQPDLCYIDTLPNEILECHILLYFWFNHWVTTFAAVCKRWKRICEHSKMAPKHIALSSKKDFDITKAIRIVAKYQPTILEIKCKPRSVPNFAFSKMISASKNLNTLILHHKDYMNMKHRGAFKNREDFSRQITTLVLHYEYKAWYVGSEVKSRKFDLNDAYGFIPHLKRLHVHSPVYKHSTDINIDEIYKESQEFYLEKHCLSTGWEILTPTDLIDKISYEKYFRNFGETKLWTALKNRDYSKAAVLLDTQQTSMEYEEYLYLYLSYQFPTSLKPGRTFNVHQYKEFLMDDQKCNKTAFDLLIATNKLEVSNSFKLLCFYQFGRITDAIEVLKTMDLKTPFSDLEIDAFMTMLLLPDITIDIIKQPNVIDSARWIVRTDHARKCLTCDYQFEKIAFLRDDWSKCEASFKIEDEALFWSMIRHGCRPSMTDLVQAENGKDILTKLGYDFQSVLFEELLYSEDELQTKLMAQYNITPTFENKSGQSLFNEQIRLGCDDEFSKHVYGNYVNHIDSEGVTPLFAAVSVTNHRLIDNLIEMGADPTIHRADCLSPLALAMTKKLLDIDDVFTIVDILLQQGADINAPCMYKERMCSPLMIAALCKQPIQLLKLLIVLGAQIDGSILDCLMAGYGTVEAARMYLEALIDTKLK